VALAARLLALSRAVTCLNFYSTKPHAFDLRSQSIGLLLATHGALALANARARERNENLKVALASNRQIAMAIGILMKARQSTPQDALALLRISSQHSNRKMAKIAADVVATGELSLPPQAPPHAKQTPATLIARTYRARAVHYDLHAATVAVGHGAQAARSTLLLGRGLVGHFTADLVEELLRLPLPDPAAAQALTGAGRVRL